MRGEKRQPKKQTSPGVKFQPRDEFNNCWCQGLWVTGVIIIFGWQFPLKAIFLLFLLPKKLINS
jgi:hypothetical protein